MDGVGVAPPSPGNAVTLANTPNLDKYWPLYPHTYLEAAGIHVGLPTGIDGNSEVGHISMGAGKILYQDLPRIDNAIKNKSFFDNPVLKDAFAHARENKGQIHVMGIVGAGKVHGSMDHLTALIEMAKKEGADPDKFFIHVFTDGRDSPPDISDKIIQKVDDECIRLRMGRVVSMMGRYYAMDRDRRWERTQAAYELITQGKGHIVVDREKYIQESYAAGKTDEFIEPTVLLANKADSPKKVNPGDSIIFFNYRPDRAIQLARAFVEEKFAGWERPEIDNLYFVAMAQYGDNFPPNIAFPPEKMTEYFGKVISENKLKQLRISESEKFAHVTYFFNVGSREVMPGETWVEIPSPKDVSTYDQKPEMSQRWCTDVLLEKLESDGYDFALINFAGPDMVGHTGVIDAAIKAMEVCDECVGRIIEKVLGMGGAVVITADHGNAEEMLDLQTGEPDTKHSVNQVPVIIIQNGLEARELTVGNLADIAPTLLALMGIEKPPEMTGRNLLA
jgi:2,3-bisphosphoglycerate-independent phosphoglycerate mutase